MGNTNTRLKRPLRQDVCGSAEEESEICGVSAGRRKAGSLINEEIQRSDQSGGGGFGSFRMTMIAPRRAKSVVFVFLVIFEENQWANALEKGRRRVIWAKKVVRKPTA